VRCAPGHDVGEGEVNVNRIAAVVALLLLTSCTRPFWTTDETVLGVQFDWIDAQTDRAATEQLCAASAILGDGRHLVGARVKFVEDNAAVGRACQPAPPERGEIAGCWSTLLNDMVVLAPAPRLADTALVHELLHRARYYAKGQMPGAEDAGHCDRFLWDQINVPATGPCP
jgi:hypothetical protein